MEAIMRSVWVRAAALIWIGCSEPHPAANQAPLALEPVDAAECSDDKDCAANYDVCIFKDTVCQAVTFTARGNGRSTIGACLCFEGRCRGSVASEAGPCGIRPNERSCSNLSNEYNIVPCTAMPFRVGSYPETGPIRVSCSRLE